MPYRRTPAVQARLDAQRVDVLAAAVALLREQGYGGCSMSAVAARAGVATGTVYRHFPSKADLAAELFRTVVRREVAAVTEAAAAHPDPVNAVVAVVETFASRALKAPRLAYALLAEPVDPAVDRERLLFRTAFRDVFAERIAAGVRLGVLPPQDARLTASALVGAGAEALVGPLRGEDAGPATLSALTAFVTRALGVPDAGHP
ncbi:TetR/AcrR family transcriptional regulator [Streptomyces chumphonensis]|uniref:TetR/AcrR family transcriptional regulator n=1 Tax=Streptomyces chumphonensis TaxID=1214925 RepID=UPI003D74DCA9